MMMCLGLLGSKGRRRGKGRTFLNSSYEKRNSVRETIIPPPPIDGKTTSNGKS